MAKLMKRMTKEEWMIEFGKRISARMDYLEMTQAELGRRAGIDPMSISQYVHGKNCPIAYHVAALAEALATTSDKLIDF